MLTVRQRYRQTDGQLDRLTDGRTTYDSNTELVLYVHRAVISRRKMWDGGLDVLLENFLQALLCLPQCLNALRYHKCISRSL